jgi:hypothetical protein
MVFAESEANITCPDSDGDSIPDQVEGTRDDGEAMYVCMYVCVCVYACTHVYISVSQ